MNMPKKFITVLLLSNLLLTEVSAVEIDNSNSVTVIDKEDVLELAKDSSYKFILNDQEIDNSVIPNLDYTKLTAILQEDRKLVTISNSEPNTGVISLDYKDLDTILNNSNKSYIIIYDNKPISNSELSSIDFDNTTITLYENSNLILITTEDVSEDSEYYDGDIKSSSSTSLTRKELLNELTSNKNYNYYLNNIPVSKDEILELDLDDYSYYLDVKENAIIVQSDNGLSGIQVVVMAIMLLAVLVLLLGLAA